MATSEITVRRKVVKRQARRRPELRPSTATRIPRISRLLALAIRFDEMLRHGEVESYAELARIGQVSRARITQIMDLLNLAPGIQEALLNLPPTSGPEPVTERETRAVVATGDWGEQARLWIKATSGYWRDIGS
jgi:hypothetical protein